MSSLEFKDSKPVVGTSKTVKSSKESIDDIKWVKSVTSEEYEDCQEGEDNENSLSSGYVHFLRDFKKRYGDYYTDHQIERAAETRWNEMSFRHRCQYSTEPIETFHIKSDLVMSKSGSSLSSSRDSEHKLVPECGPTDTFFGASATKGYGCTPRKRENKCSKPRMKKSCAKPRPKCSKPRRSCAKPKPKCARPRKACPRPRKVCAKPKPRCPKPQRSKPKCPM
ncbi:histone-like protein 18C [Drosophila erecta]|uniref:Histone-like protein 18C n=1 Tax=Drosophila erecta TaxID=7220 RepID=B3NIS5_DROER|nr:histone-like protein 18C [Drosophila erecta]XP_026833038.1 histone-like protein 18C [Drosophila erecta]EDV52571.1 uncharacterized protein Dere_GG13278 [Drosophila erecta]